VGVNPELDYRLRDVLAQWSVDWRFTVDHHTLPEQAVELNTSGMGATARHHQYKVYRDGIDMNLTTSLITLLDDDLLAQPDFAGMEAAGGFTPYPLNAFIHENNRTVVATGSLASYAGTVPASLDSGGTAWTTVMGINPATEVGWRNPAVSYTKYGDHRGFTGAAANQADLFDAFQMLYDLLKFDSIPWRPEHGESTMHRGIYLASLEGRKNYTRSLIASGDTLQHTNDPAIPGPSFYQAPVVYIRKKDSATIYPTGAAAAASHELDTAGTTNAGPRYEAVNLNDPQYGFSKVCHPNHIFRCKDPFFPSHQPYNLVTVCDTYHNNVVGSRIQAGGVIYPAADVTIAGS
jgi:hypothetical protein